MGGFLAPNWGCVWSGVMDNSDFSSPVNADMVMRCFCGCYSSVTPKRTLWKALLGPWS